VKYIRRVGAAGLQTGDASINVDASVVVMTTEILRNLLYRIGDEAANAEERLQASGGCDDYGDPAQPAALHQGRGSQRRGAPAGERALIRVRGRAEERLQAGWLAGGGAGVFVVSCMRRSAWHVVCGS
jgi:hypothetical protein